MPGRKSESSRSSSSSASASRTAEFRTTEYLPGSIYFGRRKDGRHYIARKKDTLLTEHGFDWLGQVFGIPSRCDIERKARRRDNAATRLLLHSPTKTDSFDAESNLDCDVSVDERCLNRDKSRRRPKRSPVSKQPPPAFMPLPYTAPPAVYQQYQQATQAAFVPPQQPTFLIVLPQQPSHAPPSFVPPHYVPAHASAVALVPTEVTSNEPAKMKDAKEHPESTAKRTKGDSRTRAWKLKYWCKMCGEPRSHTYHYRVATKQDAGPAICKRCQAEGTVTETILSCASVSGKSDGSHKGRRTNKLDGCHSPSSMVADFDTAFAVGPPCSECGRGRTLSSKSSDSLSDENVAVARITKVQPSADNAEKKKPHKSSSKAVEEGTTVHTEGSKSCKSPRGSDTSRTTIKVHGDNVANNSTTSKEKARKSTKYMPPTVETVTTSDQVTRSQNSPVSSTVTEEPNLGGKTNTASDSKHVQFDAHATDTKSPNRSHVADPVVPTATNNADLFASLLEEFQSPGFQMPDIDPKDPFYAPITDEDMKQAERDATNVFLSSGMSSSPPSWGMPSTQAENTIPYFGTQYETPLPHGMPEYNTSFPYGDLSHDTSFPYVGTTARDFAFPDFGSFQYASYGEAHNSHFPATPTSHDGSPNKGTGDGRLRDRSSYRHRQRRSRNHSTYSIETLDESLHVADYSMAPAKFVLVPDSEDGKDKVMRTTDTRRRRMRRLRDSLPSLHKALSTIAEPTKAPLRYSDDDVYQSESTDDSSKIAHTGHSE